MGGTLYTVIIILAILGCVGFLVWNKKKQSAANPQSSSKPGGRGIIR
jgi:hypothetical protein